MKAYAGADTIKQELKNELPKEAAEAVEEVLTKKSAEGTYYVTDQLDKILEKSDPEAPGHARLLKFKEKIEDLQKESEASARPLHWGDAPDPGGAPLTTADFDVFKDERALNELKRWKILAGI